ncbi:MAG: nuclear transport factor 2 family protein [Thermoleophilaceae bacterium]
MTADALAFIRAGYALWNAGDIEGVSGMWSEDVEWHNAPEWPGQRVYRGRDTVVRFLEDEVIDVIELGEIEVGDIEVFGAELVVKLLARTRGHGSNLDFGKVQIFHVARLEDGRVKRIRAYLDEGQALEAARAG